MRSLSGLVLAVFITACGSSASGGPTAPAGPRSAACAVSAPSAAASARGPIPPGALPPLLPCSTAPMFEYRNDALGVLLPADGRLVVDTTRSDGGAKFGWFRFMTGALTVTALRLDGSSAFRADIPNGYGVSGLQITGLRFGSPGCWEVRGSPGTGDPLTFIVRNDDPGRTSVTPEPTPISGACPVTNPSPVAFTPPSDINFHAGPDAFLYGNDALIVTLPDDGTFIRPIRDAACRAG